MQETRDSAYFGLGFAFSIISILLNCWGAGEPVWVCACEDWTLCRCTRCSTKHTGLQVIYLSGVRFFFGGAGGFERISALLGTQDLQRYWIMFPSPSLSLFSPLGIYICQNITWSGDFILPWDITLFIVKFCVDPRVSTQMRASEDFILFCVFGVCGNHVCAHGHICMWRPKALVYSLMIFHIIHLLKQHPLLNPEPAHLANVANYLQKLCICLYSTFIPGLGI